MTNRILIAIIAVCAIAPSASAEYVLRFHSSASQVGGVFQFAGGSTNTVELYLDAPVGNTDLSQFGLITADMGQPGDPLDPVNFPFVAGAELTAVVGDARIASVSPNSSIFDTRDQRVVGGTEAAWLAAQFGSPVTGSSSVLLGSFDIVAGSTLGDSGTLKLFRGQMDISLGNGTPLSLSGNLDFNFASNSTVPEPSALLLMGMAVTGGAAFLRRRKGSAQSVPVAKE